MTTTFIYGELQPSEKLPSTIWKSFVDDINVTDEEYEQETDNITKYLANFYILPPADDYQCYLRGDNYGEKTHFLEIIDFNVFDKKLLATLKEWLKTKKDWRISVPCHLGVDFTIMVYQNSYKYVSDCTLDEMILKIKDLESSFEDLDSPDS